MCALFRNENPKLGKGTTVQELSGYAGNPVGAPILSEYKPVTRVVVDADLLAGTLINWMFKAPWTCTVVSASAVFVVPATVSTTVQAYIVPVASQPEVPASGNQVFAAAQALSSATATANTVFLQTLTTSTDNLSMNPGDLLGYTISGASTALVGLLQVEIVRAD